MLGQKSQLSGESFREKLLPKENLTLQRTRNTRNIFGKRAKPFAGQKSTFYRQAYFLKGLLGCIGGLMIHLVIGSLYQWGTLSPYVTSYFKLHGHEGLTLRNMAVLFPIMMFCIGVTMKAGLDMGEKYGYHRVLIGNYFFCFIFVWCSSYLTNLFGFTALYAFGFGLMAGMTFVVPMRVCNAYFPNKQTYVNGFILIGTGVGAVVFGGFSIKFLNPHGYEPNEDGYFIGDHLDQIAYRVPKCIQWLSVLYLIIGVIGSLLLVPLEQFNTAEQQMERTVISHTLIKKLSNDTGHCLSCREAIMSPIFWVHVLIIVMGSCGNLLINTNYRVYAKDKQFHDQFLVAVGFAGSIGNGFSRFFWSSLFNRIGYKNCCFIIFILNIMCLGTIRLTRQSKWSYMGTVFILNCCLGGLLVMAPTFSASVFGKEHGPKVFGFFWCSFAMGNFLQYIFVVNFEKHITLDGIIYICLAMNLADLLLVGLYKFEAKWKNDTKFFRFKILPAFEIVKDENELLIYSVISNRVKQLELRNSLLAESTVYHS